MPMGNADNRYQVVDSDAVRKAVGDEVFERFMDRFGELVSHAKAVELDESDINLALQGEMCGFGEELTYWKHVADAYKELRAIFHESTGMCISYMFTSGEGDYYDDLSPETWYWTIPHRRRLDKDDVAQHEIVHRKVRKVRGFRPTVQRVRLNIR